MQRVRGQSLSYYGMQFAHLGVAVFIIGVTVVKGYETERDVRMNVGDTVDSGGYIFRFDGVNNVTGPNYTAEQAHFTVTRDGKPVTVLLPQKRHFNASGMPMTEAAIDTGHIPRPICFHGRTHSRFTGRLGDARLLQALCGMDLGRLPADGIGRRAGHQ